VQRPEQQEDAPADQHHRRAPAGCSSGGITPHIRWFERQLADVNGYQKRLERLSSDGH
jgi:hypothetical protein